MIKNCIKCYDAFNSRGETSCSMCRVMSLELKTDKRNFYKDRKSWNKLADDRLKEILEFYNTKNNAKIVDIKPLQRVVDYELNIHSSDF